MTENMIDLTGLTHVWGKIKTLINGCAKTSDLATVAISGSYNDLKDKPSLSNEYTLPEATASVLGGVKVGSNITVSSGTISLTKTNVTNALGYTPSTSDTTYNVATTSSNGLMSSTDKSKLDGIATGANNYTHPSTHPASIITGLATVATSGNYNDLSNKPTIENTKVTNTLATTTKAYITGTTSSSTNTGTQVFDTGVYLDTTAGTLVATTFKTSTGIEIY